MKPLSWEWRGGTVQHVFIKVPAGWEASICNHRVPWPATEVARWLTRHQAPTARCRACLRSLKAKKMPVPV